MSSPITYSLLFFCCCFLFCFEFCREKKKNIYLNYTLIWSSIFNVTTEHFKGKD